MVRLAAPQPMKRAEPNSYLPRERERERGQHWGRGRKGRGADGDGHKAARSPDEAMGDTKAVGDIEAIPLSGHLHPRHWVQLPGLPTL